MTQPCKRDCPGRSPTCHAECEKYRRFANQQREEYKRRLDEAEITTALFDGRVRCGKFVKVN